MSFLELEISDKNLNLIGLDEVGRGPIAGPVVAGGVVFSGSRDLLASNLDILKELKVTDSKKLTRLKRKSILQKVLNGEEFQFSDFKLLKKYSLESVLPGFFFCLQKKSPKEIEKLNILWATMEAMGDCTNLLGVKGNKTHVWVDGNRAPKNISASLEVKTLIKGDERSLVIGLASIIAKEFRDQLMDNLGLRYPEFSFSSNSGYPTPKHINALKLHGKTVVHRNSFKTVKSVSKLYGEE